MRRLHVFIIPSRYSGLSSGDVSDVRMMPYCKETVYDGTTESTRGANVKHFLSASQLHREYASNSNVFSGSYNSNPSVTQFWIVLIYTEGYTNEEIDVYFDVKLKYYSILTRSTEPNES